MREEKRIVEQMLSTAGIRINGSEPWDILANDDRFYNRVLREGS